MCELQRFICARLRLIVLMQFVLGANIGRYMCPRFRFNVIFFCGHAVAAFVCAHGVFYMLISINFSDHRSVLRAHIIYLYFCDICPPPPPPHTPWYRPVMIHLQHQTTEKHQ